MEASSPPTASFSARSGCWSLNSSSARGRGESCTGPSCTGPSCTGPEPLHEAEAASGSGAAMPTTVVTTGPACWEVAARCWEKPGAVATRFAEGAGSGSASASAGAAGVLGIALDCREGRSLALRRLRSGSAS